MKQQLQTTEETEELEAEAAEPMQPEALIPLIIQDILEDQSPEAIAEDFFEQFVETNRPEAAHIIGLLDLPDDAIVQLVAQMQAQTLAMFSSKAPSYLANLRMIVGKRLAERVQKS